MKRSRQAKLYEKLARKVVLSKGKTIEELILAYKKAEGKQKYNLPILVKLSEKVDDVMAKDMHLFYMNVESDSNKLIIYLHGGAYVQEMLVFHWLMLDKITSISTSTFIIPEYPLAPYSDFKECYGKMMELYKNILKYYPDKEIIFMGDSAGGGLATGLSMYFAENNLRVPDKLILLSPWIDLLMDNEKIEDYIKLDPTLKRDELSVDAKYWANGTDLKDYRISPKYGDVSVLKNVSVFVGTHEILYPDIMEFVENLKKHNVLNRLFIGEGLNHVYPAYPTPEADQAIAEICKLIDE